MKEKLEDDQAYQTKPTNRKKRRRRILIWLWLIALFCFFVCLVFFLYAYLKFSWWWKWWWVRWMYATLLLIPLCSEILIVYFIIYCRSKRHLSAVLIIFLLLLALIWICLTKNSVIPDYFEFNCLGEKKVIKDDCIDCKCKIIYHASIENIPLTDEWNLCCEWTYKEVKTGIN